MVHTSTSLEIRYRVCDIGKSGPVSSLMRAMWDSQRAANSEGVRVDLRVQKRRMRRVIARLVLSFVV